MGGGPTLGEGLFGGLVVCVQCPDCRMSGIVSRAHGTHVDHWSIGSYLVVHIGREILLSDRQNTTRCVITIFE